MNPEKVKANYTRYMESDKGKENVMWKHAKDKETPGQSLETEEEMRKRLAANARLQPPESVRGPTQTMINGQPVMIYPCRPPQCN